MLIGGVRFTKDNLWSEIVDALKSLPPMLSTTQAPPPPKVVHAPGSQADIEKQVADATYQEWSEDPADEEFYETAIATQTRCIETAKKENNLLAEAESLRLCGEICSRCDARQLAIDYYQNAAMVYQRLGHIDQAYWLLGEAHDIACRQVDSLEKYNARQEAIDNAREQLRSLRKRSMDARWIPNNEPVDESAIRVEQGEAGFSRSTPIGTCNIHECISIVVMDPDTNDTSVTHFDFTTNAADVEAVLENVRPPPVSPNAKPLKVFLFGAEDYSESEEYAFEHFLNIQRSVRAQVNLRKVTEALLGKNVEIVSADVLSASQVESIVAYPETQTVRQAVPGIFDRNAQLRFASLSTFNVSESTARSRLNFAFDVRTSQTRGPVFLNLNSVQQLLEKGKTEKDIYAWFRNCTQTEKQYLPTAVECSVLLVEGHREAVESLVTHMHACVKKQHQKIKKYDSAIQCPPFDFEKARQAIETFAIHIGDGADAANQAIFRLIDVMVATPNKFIKITRPAPSQAEFNWDALHALKNSNQMMRPPTEEPPLTDLPQSPPSSDHQRTLNPPPSKRRKF